MQNTDRKQRIESALAVIKQDYTAHHITDHASYVANAVGQLIDAGYVPESPVVSYLAIWHGSHSSYYDANELPSKWDPPPDELIPLAVAFSKTSATPEPPTTAWVESDTVVVGFPTPSVDLSQEAEVSEVSQAQFISPGTAATVLVTVCHGAAKNWWIDPKTGANIRDNPFCFGNRLMLVVTELAEAMEGHRKGLKDDHLPHRDMAEVEIADAIIRLADMAGGFGMDLGGAIVEKLAYNAERQDHKVENRVKAGGKAY